MFPESLLLPPDLRLDERYSGVTIAPASAHGRHGGALLLCAGLFVLALGGQVAHSAAPEPADAPAAATAVPAAAELMLAPTIAWAEGDGEAEEEHLHELEAEVLPPLPPSLAALGSGRRVVHASMTPERRAPVTVAAAGFGGLTFVPFEEKRGEYLAGQRLGYWPAERRRISDPAYANPSGFYLVDASSSGHPISPHFTLGEFAMSAARRGSAGESYVVVRDVLLEKLERLIVELERRGVRGADLRILSGFRAPHYNAGIEGAAPSSRHQFGDAADLVVDADGDGRMDDLNGDGRVDRRDIWIVAEAIEQIERESPHLVGGIGLYDAVGPSGPFLHVDVRGRSSRWGTALAGAPLRNAPTSAPRAAAPTEVRTSTCRAAPEMAALCITRARRN